MTTASGADRDRSTAVLLAGAFLLALAVRVAYLLAFRESPYFAVPQGDGAWHHAWAQDWARGVPVPGAFFRAPLYPGWLSLLYRFSEDPWTIRLVQAVIGAVSVALIAGAGRRWFGLRAGIAAGGIAALYGPLVVFDGELLIPNLLVLILSAALWVMSGPPGPGARLGAALLVGLAGIARPSALVLIPLLVLAESAAGRGRRARVWEGALIVAVALLPAGLVTARNARVEPGLVPVASQAGVNLAAGNRPHATGRSIEIPELRDLVRPQEIVERSRLVAGSERGVPTGSAQASWFWTRRALSWIGAHPSRALGLTARKAYYLVNAYEIPSNRDLYADRPGILRVLLWAVPGLAVPWGLVFPLAVAGWLSLAADRHPGTGRARRAARGLTLWIGLYGLSILPFFVTGRFRMGLVPPLILLAGLALSRGRRLLTPGVLTAAGLAFVIANSALFQVRDRNPSLELARRGTALLQLGRVAEAEAALRESLDDDPHRVVPLLLLGEIRLQHQDWEEAAELFTRARGLRPDEIRVHLGLGMALLGLDRADEATGALELALRVDPGNAAVWANLGRAYAGRGFTARAGEAYREALRRAPDDPGLTRWVEARLAELEGEGPP